MVCRNDRDGKFTACLLLKLGAGIPGMLPDISWSCSRRVRQDVRIGRGSSGERLLAQANRETSDLVSPPKFSNRPGIRVPEVFADSNGLITIR